MGIKDLFSFLQKHNVPYEQQRATFFANSTIAIDAFSLCFRLFYIGKKISITGHATLDLLEAFLNKWPKTTTLIFVFDSPVKNAMKMETIQKRRESEQIIRDEIKELEEKLKVAPFNPVLLSKRDTLLRRSKDNFPYKEIEEFLTGKGHRLIKAPGEAEKYASQMVLRGEANYVYSSDSDCLAIGCPATIFDEHYNFLKIYRMELILQTLDLSQRQFREFCVLLGTDFNSRVFGPEEAYRLIKQHETMERIPNLSNLSFLQDAYNLLNPVVER